MHQNKNARTGQPDQDPQYSTAKNKISTNTKAKKRTAKNETAMTA
jgi:hypothetical protein